MLAVMIAILEKANLVINIKILSTLSYCAALQVKMVTAFLDNKIL